MEVVRKFVGFREVRDKEINQNIPIRTDPADSVNDMLNDQAKV